ncbi:MAG: DNA repair protein RecN (Recombination protein N) [Chitinophagaceae bacterium]|nr:MAG: DNA repair protein RecN (Recombination protein N) [Chitinophagaceae bacterium]
MLRKLIIQNYAIIDEITIDFSQQLNIITGETGAGKSILMGALSLILGERADSSVLVNNQKKCFIEGYFKADHKAEVIDYLKLQELDIDEDLVLRREIATNGKSRAFINDTPATLQQLKHLAGLLVDLHQQFDTLELGDSDFQRQVIDALAGNEATLLSYRTVYFNWQHITKELQSLKEAKAAFLKEFDYHQFLFNELEELNLKEHELEELEVELKMLSNAEGIKTNIDLVQNSLHNSEQPIVGQLKQLGNHLNAFAALHQELPELVARMKATQVELQDIADELEKISTHIQFDEKRIEWINQRMSDGYKLVKKHGVQNSHDLILGMPNAKIQTRLLPTSLQEYGKEQIDLLFDANNSNRFEPIRKVASGGELSRLMLCIKSLVAESIDLPTLIFDEIDTGISGEAAKQVGLIMQKMAAQRQIICITHQPQIAGKANAHFYVYKEKKGEMVKTTIRLLDNDERIKAIASMLSGEKPTTAAMENAREMMN